MSRCREPSGLCRGVGSARFPARTAVLNLMLAWAVLISSQGVSALAGPAPSGPGAPEAPADEFKRVAARGFVRDAKTLAPVVGATVRVEGEGIEVRTDASGQFVLPPLVPRTYLLLITAEGYARAALKVPLYGQGHRPTILLKRGSEKVFHQEAIEVVTTTVTAPRPVEHVLTVKELEHVPGSFNDAVRTIQNLPGVGRNPLGLLIVRGTEPQDTGYYIDGIRVPMIFHFLGLHTVVNTDVLDQVTFLPGNYNVRYGRTYGGVVDITTTENIPYEWGGYVGVDLLNTLVMLDVPVKPGAGLYLSFRRGYIDFVLEHGVQGFQRARGEDVDMGFIQAPKYFDYQAIYNQRIGPRDFLHLLAFGAKDDVRMVTDPPASIPPGLRGENEAGADNSFYKLLGRWRHSGDEVINELTLSFGPGLQRYTFGGMDVTGINLAFIMREDLRFRLPTFPGLTLRAGLDGFLGQYRMTLDVPFDPYTTVELDPLGETESTTVEVRGWYLAPGLFLEGEYDPTRWLKLVGGIRADPLWFPGQYTALWFDPRLAVSVRPWKQTTFKASLGRYGDIPPPFAIDSDFGGQTDLKPPFSTQASLGLEHHFTSFLYLETTAFYNDLRRLVIIPSTPGAVDGKPDFTNDGRGRNRGVEFLLRHNPANNFFGWISYTLLKAERLDGLEPASDAECSDPDFQGPCWYPFDYDQTHILTVVASYDLPRGWTLGARFRYSTGTPYTPVGGAVYDVDTNDYDPLPQAYGQVNQSRLPSFDDLTLRVDKVFKRPQWKLNTYLEVINVYNKCNPEAITYNFDYSEEAHVCGLPIFPNLGVKAVF